MVASLRARLDVFLAFAHGSAVERPARVLAVLFASAPIACGACSLAVGGTGAPFDAGVDDASHDAAGADGAKEPDASPHDSASPVDAISEAPPSCIGCVGSGGACTPIGMPCDATGTVCTPSGTCVS